jgi:hypothetical protein
MTPEQKKWIDEASYQDLLARWRFALTGDPFFQGASGTYYAKVMADRRDADPDAAVRASKLIGWDPP